LAEPVNCDRRETAKELIGPFRTVACVEILKGIIERPNESRRNRKTRSTTMRTAKVTRHIHDAFKRSELRLADAFL